MDVDKFIVLERQRLHEERALLSARNGNSRADEYAAAELLDSATKQNEKSKMNNKIADTQKTITNSKSSMDPTNSTLEELQEHLSKAAKEWANQHEMNAHEKRQQLETHQIRADVKANKKDDMEQWVTDTFYSYFPGYSNELQKRQNYLRERQQEFQQNLLRHQQQNPKPSKLKKQTEAAIGGIAAENQDVRNISFSNDKTDLEIINVNNPNYAPSKYTAARPESSRQKLLQDLKHTDLSNIVVGDGVLLRNRQNEELAVARKKDYQRELMEQIEDKRRSIELLREKERRQDESLTRRLEEQLRTINLEERLEKERLRIEKLKFDAAQNRLIREKLVSDLKQDCDLVTVGGKKKTYKTTTKNKENRNFKADQTPPTSVSSSSTTTADKNKVYKYFSNSAGREYRRGRDLPMDDVEISLRTIQGEKKTELECCHMYEKICPFCDEPLKTYESCCLRCQRKLSLKIASKNRNHNDNMTNKEQTNNIEDETNANASGEKQNNEKANANNEDALNDCNSSFLLVCHKCERLYAMCPTCIEKSDVCRACHRKRNVCMNCRRTLCTFCLEEIACGRDTDRHHINDEDIEKKQALPSKHPAVCASSLDHSFQILELQHSEGTANETARSVPSLCSSLSTEHPNSRNNSISESNNHPQTTSSSYKIYNNDLHEEKSFHEPYSSNITPKSVFQADSKQPKLKPNLFNESSIKDKVPEKHFSFDLPIPSAAFNTSEFFDNEQNMERVVKETERRLSRYMKNYGDLAQYASVRSKSESRGTQTTPHSSGRRDIVLQDTNNLSMPLLREMPKMTRKDHNYLQQAGGSPRKIENLKRRWEVPAVQKYSITANSPRVLTQVGAIRKQLQVDYLLHDDK